MRLSTVFELLLIFLFIAFAASRSVDKHHSHHHHKIGQLKSRQATVTKPASAAPNRYCQCTSDMCNCCRDFSLPVVSLKGPGCANVQYLNGDSMRLTMSFGDRILRNFTLSGKKPRPVCMGLPGAETRFCGRIYGIQRVGDQFKACLALELRSSEDIEAALRVSCFKFGPDGVKLEPGKPVPDTDDYDDDDDYGFDDEDDDDDDDFLAADDEDDDDDDEENDVDSGDYTGFSALGDEFLDGFFDSVPTKNKKKKHSANGGHKPAKATTKKPTVTDTGAIATTAKAETTSDIPVTASSNMTSSPAQPTVQSSTPWKSVSNSSESSTESLITSTEYSVQVIQDGVTLDGSDGLTQATTTTQEISSSTIAAPVKNLTTEKENNGEGEEEEEEEEGEEEEEEETPQPQEEQVGEENKDGAENENKVSPQSKDDDENILDGILGDDDDDEDEEDDGEKEVDKDDDDDDDDDDEDEFRQLRSHVPRGPYQPMTLEDTERRFPGLSALIKPPSVPFMSLQEQERRFPGLAALIRQPNQSPYSESSNAEIAFDFPPVRSARTHRRMRLPPQ